MKTKKQHDVEAGKLCSLIKRFTSAYGTDNSRWRAAWFIDALTA